MTATSQRLAVVDVDPEEGLDPLPALDQQQYVAAARAAGGIDRCDHLLRLGDRLAIDRNDHVAAPEAFFGRIAAGRDKANILFVAFLVSGGAVLAVPFVPGTWLVGGALFFYGLANGVISPMQKSLLTQNAPAELRGGIVSFDRLIQQVSKTTSTSIVGLLLVSAELPTIFWLLGILSIISVVLMACLLPRSRAAVSSPSVS